MDQNKFNTNTINKLNKILELGYLTNAQRLYLNYANAIGLDINWLNENVIHNDNIYKINGLIWKYKFISLEDDIINNTLLIELEYIRKYIKPQNISIPPLENNKSSNIINSANTAHLYRPISGSTNNNYTSWFTTCNYGPISSSSIGNNEKVITEEYLNSIFNEQIENPKIKQSQSENGIKIVELNTFIKSYKFENSEFIMPTNITIPKFRLIIENN